CARARSRAWGLDYFDYW
nr:immunoglobulin heavy chain junction region [Macaca mulatta]MOV86709.1 immunoglobulin heavy chain junction region [Macaca mulatta]MOV86824.1 immunoglobulin heavy chain junction region [Macaca mulatta]MOV86884.1 immunoglobulin heavy chain junction region [Macaca mulatta]MOV86996.1 immunoglobulin heavy chain junction region [Macaca mulatta]